MKNKKVISFITTLALASTMIFNSSVNVIGKEIDNDLLIAKLKEQLKEKGVNEFENLKGYSLNGGKTNEFRENHNEDEEIRVIIQLEESPAIENTDGKYNDSVKNEEERIKNSQGNLINKVEEITGTSVIRNFGYLVNGFSITTKRKDVEKIKNLDGVKSVTEDSEIKPNMKFSNEITKAASVWKDLGYKGEGIVVSIIDTGIDYTHKDLQKINTDKIKLTKNKVQEKVNELGYGKSFTDKIPFGYNYADGNDNIIADSNQHGMHVAGIVAANGDVEKESSFEAVRGVAPEAQLLAMKVFSNNPNNPGAYNDGIIAAIEDSVKLGADVINMSLGKAAGQALVDEDPESIAVKNAIDAGVICVISAGNSQTSTTISDGMQPLNFLGIKDTGMIATPSITKGAISVASSENDVTEVSAISYETKEGISKKIPFLNSDYSDLSLLSGFYEVVDCGKGRVTDKEDDFKGKDLKGKIALIEKGEIMFRDKYINAISRGALGMIMYNNTNVPVMLGTMFCTSFAFSIGKDDGLVIKELIKKGDKYFKFSYDGSITSINNSEANDMSTFSTWGTASDLEFKPEITAPGGKIYSIQNNNNYASMSGTSMSTPNMAGAEALILQSMKKKDIKLNGSELVGFAKNTAMNTAKVLIDKYDETKSIPYSPRRQGAGLIQIEDAIKNNVTITYKDGKAAAALKEVGKNTTFKLELKNYGTEDATYDLSKEKVFGEVIDDNYIQEVELNDSFVTFDKEQVTVKAGETAEVTANMNISNNVEKDNFVEGFIKFNSESSSIPSLSVPFMGFYGDWSKESIVDAPNYTDGVLKTYVGSSGIMNTVDDKHIYSGAVEVNASEEFKETKIDKERVAFSPNNDGVLDDAVPMLYFLRNAVNVRVQVVDSSENIIRDLYSSSAEGRIPYFDFCYNQELGRKLPHWDGTVYNSSTGKYENVEDGRYLIRVKSSVGLEGSKEQVLDLPVKVDTVAPKVKIEGVKAVNDADGKKHYNFTWSESDNENGSGIKDVFAIAINGNIVDIDYNSISKEDGKYTVELPFVEGEINTVQIAAMDNAGNVTEAKEKVKVSELKSISFSNLSDGMILGKKDLMDSKYAIEGTAGDDLKKLVINDKEVNLKDNEFKEDIDVQEGENLIKVYAEDNYGKVVMKNTYRVVVDTTPPEFSVLPEGLTKTSSYYATDKECVDLDISLINETDVDVSIEGEKLKVDNGHAFKSINLNEGLNTLNVSVVDKANNISMEKIKIIRTSGLDKFKVTFDNLNLWFVSSKDTVNGVYSILGHVNKKIKVFKINGQDIKIKDDLSFSYTLKLNNGNNLLKVYAENEKGNIEVNYSYMIYYDETVPTLKLNNLLIREDGKVYTNKDLFNVSGKITDNKCAYLLRINGDNIAKVDASNLEKEFSKDIPLNLGLNKIIIDIKDEFDIESYSELKVVLDKEAPDKPKLELSNGGISNDKVTVKVNSDEAQIDKIEYSFDGVNFVPYSGEFIVDDNATVYARVTDYAGNISEVEKANIIIDKVAPVVTIDGVNDGETYNKALKPIINVDDKESKVIILLNGKEYNGEAIESEGEFKLEAYAVDKAGNKSEDIIKNFKIVKKYAMQKYGTNLKVNTKINNIDEKDVQNKIINNKNELKSTGDKNNMNIFVVLSIVAVTSAIASFGLYRRKKKLN